MIINKISLLTLITVFIFFNSIAKAQSVNIAMSRINVINDRLAGEVYVKEKLVFQVYQENSNDPEITAGEITKKINTLYSQGIKPDKLTVKLEIKESKIGKKTKKEVTSASIYWDKENLFTISSAQAKLNKSNPKTLSDKWLKNLKNALSLKPVFKASSPQIIAGPGETKEIKINSNIYGKLTWKVKQDSNIIDIVKINSEKRITLKALKPGEAVIELQIDNFTDQVKVSVKEFAGKISKISEITVSGNPCPGDFIREAVLREINNSVILNSKAKIVIDPFNINPSPLYSDKKTQITLPIKIEGQTYINLNKTISVNVKNKPLQYKEPQSFIMCNSPEKIMSKGVILSESLKKMNSPVQILYYHLNSSKTDKWLIVELINNNKEDALVWSITGLGGPNKQEAFVGHVATSRFIKNSYYRLGQMYIIPGGGRKWICMQKFAPGDVITGLCHLQFHSSTSLDLNIRAEDNPYESPSINQLPPDQVSTHCRGVFPEPKLSFSENYTVGDPEKSIYIGKSPFLVSGEDKEELYGNYGVLYDITLKLTNNTTKVQDIDISFTSQGGIAQGTFLIDGTLVETPIVKSSERVSIVTLFLKAGEKRTVHLQTMPQGGSHYPVRILIKN